jgi:hypothetical protein
MSLPRESETNERACVAAVCDEEFLMRRPRGHYPRNLLELLSLHVLGNQTSGVTHKTEPKQMEKQAKVDREK